MSTQNVAFKAWLNVELEDLEKHKAVPRGLRYKSNDQAVVITSAGDLEKKYGLSIAFRAVLAVSVDAIQRRIKSSPWNRIQVNIRHDMQLEIFNQRSNPRLDIFTEQAARRSGNVYRYAEVLEKFMGGSDPWDAEGMRVRSISTKPVTIDDFPSRRKVDWSQVTHWGPYRDVIEAVDAVMDGNPLPWDDAMELVETYHGKYYVRNLNYKPV